MKNNKRFNVYKGNKELNENTWEMISSFLDLTLGTIGVSSAGSLLYFDKISGANINPTVVGLATASSALILLESVRMGFLGKEQKRLLNYVDDAKEDVKKEEKTYSK